MNKIPADLVSHLQKCEEELLSDILKPRELKQFKNFTETELANIIVGCNRRKVAIIRNVPLSNAIKETDNGVYSNFSIIGNFRGVGVNKLTTNKGNPVDPNSYFNCMPKFEYIKPRDDVLVDGYVCDTGTIVQLQNILL